jgi:ribose transport system ATP-binding protein
VRERLVKILGGAVEPDEGQISIDGNEYSALTPWQAQELGIAIIYQEFNLVPWLSVEANLFLGKEQRSSS